MTFNELVRLLEENGFTLVRQKGSIRYYGKDGWPRLVRVDYHGPKQVPKGTCHTTLKAAGLPNPSARRLRIQPPPDNEADEEQP